MVSESVADDSMDEDAIPSTKKHSQSALQNKKLSSQMQKASAGQTQKTSASQVQNGKTKKASGALADDSMHEDDSMDEDAIPSTKKQSQSALQNKKLSSQMQKASAGQTQKTSTSQMQNGKRKKASATSATPSASATSSTSSASGAAGQPDIRKSKGKALAVSTKPLQASTKQKSLATMSDKAPAALKATSKSAMAKDRNITFVNGDDDSVDIAKAFRSRSNSSTTLAPTSQRPSQNTSQSTTTSKAPQPTSKAPQPTSKAPQPTSKVVSKSEDVAWDELNIMGRRWYLATLSNTFVDEPIQAVFVGMKPTNSIYIEAKTKLQRAYKQWKFRTLKEASKWMKRYIAVQKQSRIRELNAMTMEQLKTVVSDNFDDSWLSSVFGFGLEAVNFDDITELGLRFLRCKFYDQDQGKI